jgi:CheY-like chemotaxis protein
MPRVLLVDDDRDLLEIYGTALRSAGYEVSVAHDSDEAFELIGRGSSFDVAVLDVVMRTPNEGFVLARRMRGDPRTSRIPLVMVSSVNAVNAEKGFDFRFSDRDRDPKWLPIDRFVDKPVKAGRLVALVRELAA